MALSQSDWREIQKMVGRMVGQIGQAFVQGEVVKSDPTKKLVWLKEFGDQPIPLIAFDYQVKYYYNEPFGNTTAVGNPVNTRMKTKKTQAYSKEVEVLCPKPGDIVLVAQHMGSRRLPKCLGVIKSKNYVTGD